MKNILLILVLLLTLGCSNDDLFDNQDFETQMETLRLIELMDPYEGFGFNLYAQTKGPFPKLLDCTPTSFDSYKLHSNYFLSGVKFDNGAEEAMSGKMKLAGCNYDSGTHTILNNISGNLKNGSEELIFYSGKLYFDLDTRLVSGVIRFSSGTGQYANCSGEVELIGSIEYGFLKLDCKGKIDLN